MLYNTTEENGITSPKKELPPFKLQNSKPEEKDT
jgi:hypothetical protein